jgi:hypothetical protein
LRIAFALCLAALGVVIFAARTVGAEPPAPELMAKLAATSAGLDRVRKHATFAIETRIETLDGDGNVTGVKTISQHVVREGVTTHVVVDNATKDGKDWTRQAQREEDEKQAAREKDEKKGRLDIPFLASEQSHYAFNMVETDLGGLQRRAISVGRVQGEQARNLRGLPPHHSRSRGHDRAWASPVAHYVRRQRRVPLLP